MSEAARSLKRYRPAINGQLSECPCTTEMVIVVVVIVFWMLPVLVDFSHTLPEGLLSLSRGGTADGMGSLEKATLRPRPNFALSGSTAARAGKSTGSRSGI